MSRFALDRVLLSTHTIYKGMYPFILTFSQFSKKINGY